MGLPASAQALDRLKVCVHGTRTPDTMHHPCQAMDTSKCLKNGRPPDAAPHGAGSLYPGPEYFLGIVCQRPGAAGTPAAKKFGLTGRRHRFLRVQRPGNPAAAPAGRAESGSASASLNAKGRLCVNCIQTGGQSPLLWAPSVPTRDRADRKERRTGTRHSWHGACSTLVACGRGEVLVARHALPSAVQGEDPNA